MSNPLFNTKLLTKEEEKELYADLLGYDMGNVDFTKVDDELTKSIQIERVRNEMIEYLTCVLMSEYNKDDRTEAMLMWDSYKMKHNIVI